MDRISNHSGLAQIGRQLGQEIISASTKFEKDSELGNTSDLTRYTAEKLHEVASAFSINDPAEIVEKLGRLLVTMSETTKQYAYAGQEHAKAATTYIDHCASILERMSAHADTMELRDQFYELLVKHGQDSHSILEYASYLIGIYQHTINDGRPPDRPKANFTTATYGQVIDPQDRVTVPEIKTESELLPDDSEARTNRHFPPVFAPAPPDEFPLPVPRSRTHLGIGAESEEGLRQMGNANPVVVPPLVASTLAELGAVLEQDINETVVDNKLLDVVIAQERQVAQSVRPPAVYEPEPDEDATIPPTSEAVFQAAMNVQQTLNAMRRKKADSQPDSSPVNPVTPPDITPEPTVRTIEDEVTNVMGQPVAPVPLVESAEPSPTVEPVVPAAPPQRTAAFTTEWVEQEGAQYGHTQALSGARGPDSKLIAMPAPTDIIHTPKPAPLKGPSALPPAEPVVAPAPQMGAFTTEWVQKEGPKFGHAHVLRNGKVDPDPQKPNFTNLSNRSATPVATQKSTRKSLWFALAGVLGLAGIATVASTQFNKSSDQSNTTETSSATVSASATSTPTSTSPETAPQQKKVETQVASEKGIFKINSDHAAYKNYLEKIKLSTGLVAIIKDITGQVKIDYFQNPADLEAAKKSGLEAISGQETVMEQRIAIMDAFLTQALNQNIENQWVVSYFRNHQLSLNNYKATGKWEVKGRSYDTDKFFEAFQVPVKLVSSAEVIGYAPDIDPATNPALIKIQQAAPTFHQAYLEAGRRMQRETDPTKMVAYNDFNLIKKATCARIEEVRLTYRDPDARGGIAYMRNAWCNGTANSYNYLNQALKHTVELHANTTTPSNPPQAQKQPDPGQIHNNIIQQPSFLQQQPTLAPQPQWNEPAPKEKPGIVSRAFKSIKSFFGFGEKAAPATPDATPSAKPKPQPVQAQPTYQEPVSSNDYIYTEKDIPMYTWKETLKNYFWG